MTFADAQYLVTLAHKKDLYLSCAPCNLLSETAQTLWKALREKTVGSIRAVYAEMDDGLLHTMPYRQWTSKAVLVFRGLPKMSLRWAVPLNMQVTTLRMK